MCLPFIYAMNIFIRRRADFGLVELAQNNNVKLKLGWHVLRNKSHSTMNDTIEQREKRESTFFANSKWKGALKPSQLGVAALRERLRIALWKPNQ
jgi:hypothetical protein